MSVRYSGDTEVRVRYHPHRRVYIGTVTDPYLRWRGEVPRGAVRSGRSGSPDDPDMYDAAARELIARADRWARGLRKRFMVDVRRNRQIRVSRVFQAPCPLE